MKNLILTTAKVFKLSFVMIALASVPGLAGGNDKIEVKKSHDETYAKALTDMEKALDETEELETFHTPMPHIKVYDAKFNLVKEADIPADGLIEDEELLILIHKSNEFMTFEYITYYILKD